ncbi:hypothetical protein [Luteolibacter soli]|uniref:Uncharacterized protein n=1 Tax=Luteolibacter soli TaxID=3135280 RepID=A0ABU9AZ52_9BACT
MLLLLALLMPIPSCAPATAVPASEANTLPWRGNESGAYRQGHKDGSGDKRAGRASAPKTGEGADYLLGYQDGYRYPNDNPWSRQRAYQLGQEYGRRDQLAGQTADPARHANVVPRAVRDEFIQGYRVSRR